MKTPDKIKKGLERCGSFHGSCFLCPYSKSGDIHCIEKMEQEVLTMPNKLCDCCGKELSDKIQEWGGLWLNLQDRVVSMHYHKECAQKVYDAVMACCEREKKEGAGDGK